MVKREELISIEVQYVCGHKGMVTASIDEACVEMEVCASELCPECMNVVYLRYEEEIDRKLTREREARKEGFSGEHVDLGDIVSIEVEYSCGHKDTDMCLYDEVEAFKDMCSSVVCPVCRDEEIELERNMLCFRCEAEAAARLIPNECSNCILYREEVL
jgi:hypothetical protein